MSLPEQKTSVVKKPIKVVKRSEINENEQKLKRFDHDFSKFPEQKKIWDPNPKLTEKAYKIICQAWLKDDKSRNFVKHLIAAFFPINSFDKILNAGDEELKCAILGIKLTGIGNISTGITEFNMAKMMADAHATIEERKQYTEEEVQKLETIRDSLPIEIREGRFAWCSDRSDKLLSNEALTAFRIFVETVAFIPEFEKEFTFLIKKMQINSFQENTNFINNKLDKTEINKVAKATTFGIKAVAKIGDNIDPKTLSALEKLKLQMEEQDETEYQQIVADHQD